MAARRPEETGVANPTARGAPRVQVVTPERARGGALPAGFAGTARGSAYLDGARDPVHLHLWRIAPGERLAIGPLASDCLGYVWQGAVAAGGRALAAGSSLIVEHGALLMVAGAGAGEAWLLCFAGSAPAAHGRAGGQVHLLPAEQVPGAEVLAGSNGVGGRMHADGQCSGCEVWLHENTFAPAEPLRPALAARGVHAHSEAEVIFIADGAIRLGQRLYPAGTAIAIAADTLYAIGAGPQGMRFINFRAGTPSDIRFASGTSMSETGYWRERVARPAYLEPVSA